MLSSTDKYFSVKKDYIFLNPFSYYLIRKSKLFSKIMNSNVLIFLDGFLLVYILRILGFKKVFRVSFDDTSLAPYVFQHCVNSKLTLGLVGSAPGIAVKAAEHIKLKYPDIEIKFIQDGFYNKNDEYQVIEKAIKCDVIICSMGTPRQENFLTLLRRHNWQGTGYTCGGYLDQLVFSNGTDYYPKYIDKFNLRWLYRIWKEPRRLLLRYVIDYPKGITLFIYDLITRKFNQNNFG